MLAWLPFRYMLSFPVENALGLLSRTDSLRALGMQWAWVMAFLLVTTSLCVQAPFEELRT